MSRASRQGGETQKGRDCEKRGKKNVKVRKIKTKIYYIIYIIYTIFKRNPAFIYQLFCLFFFGDYV